MCSIVATSPRFSRFFPGELVEGDCPPTDSSLAMLMALGTDQDMFVDDGRKHRKKGRKEKADGKIGRVRLCLQPLIFQVLPSTGLQHGSLITLQLACLL